MRRRWAADTQFMIESVAAVVVGPQFTALHAHRGDADFPFQQHLAPHSGATPTRGFAEHDATVIGLPAHLT